MSYDQFFQELNALADRMEETTEQTGHILEDVRQTAHNLERVVRDLQEELDRRESNRIRLQEECRLQQEEADRYENNRMIWQHWQYNHAFLSLNKPEKVNWQKEGF